MRKKKKQENIKEKRCDSTYKENEKRKNIERMQLLRRRDTFSMERRKNKQRMQMKRIEDKNYAIQEKVKNTQRIKRKRARDEDYTAQEKRKNIKRMKIMREVEHYQAQEKINNTRRMERTRNEDEIYAIQERDKNAIRMQKKRKSNEDYITQEKDKNKRRMKRKRTEDDSYVTQEKIKNNRRMEKMRTENEDYRTQENDKNGRRIKRKRADDENYATQEKIKNNERIQKKRAEDEGYKRNERITNKDRMKVIRSEQNYTQKENEANILRMHTLRDENSYRESERNHDRMAKRVQRGCAIITHRNTVYNHLNEDKSNIQSRLLLKFIENRQQVPNYMCCCCEGAFFEAGVVKITREKVKLKLKIKARFSESIIDSRILNSYDERMQNYACHTCIRYIENGKVPKLASSNGLKLPLVPECLKILNDIEERLLAPFVPFMKVILMSHRASNPQVGMKGSVVYIPVDVNEMILSLPRNLHNVNIMAIPVDFKRNLGHSSSYLRGYVRPEVLKNAANYLRSTELYQKYGIEFANNFSDEYENDANIDDLISLKDGNENIAYDDDMDSENEFYQQLNDGDDECLLFDFNEIVANNSVVVMAPGIGQRRAKLLLYYQNVGGINSIVEQYRLAVSDKSFDIIVFVETWLNDDTLSSQVFGTEYEVFRCDRSPSNSRKSTGGGVLVAVKTSLKARIVENTSWDCLEQVWTIIELGDRMFQRKFTIDKPALHGKRILCDG
ncbi:uncharacterized protein LOC131696040 [Topomyia yanbarensis]|uniref:uncharacterized protein LOC131696040 n=1 Tax=Topomyia yanbarensis TaxID=2498891 RepID=UPI00273B2DFA|nr:uncharacterized protein LOC131696040 [Topomyia yanbarensis]